MEVTVGLPFTVSFTYHWVGTMQTYSLGMSVFGFLILGSVLLCQQRRNPSHVSLILYIKRHVTNWISTLLAPSSASFSDVLCLPHHVGF